MKNLFLCGAAALALTACGQLSSDADTNAKSNGEKAAQTTAPELGAWGVEIADINPEVDPGDNFYNHVNGKWLDTFEIPDEFSSYGAFTVLFERSEDRVKNIIETAAAGNAADGSIEQKIGDLYASFVDVDAINAKGLDPLAEDFAAINAAASHEDIGRLMASPTLGVTTPFGAFMNVDAKQTDRYIMYITQGGLGMPNRDYYLDEKFADKRAKYQEYIAQVFTLAGAEDAEAKAQGIYDLETRIAEAHWEPSKRRNRDLTYNLKSLDELKAFAPEAPWDAMFDEAGVGGQTEFVVREDDAIQNLATIFGETPVSTWQDYLTFHTISGNRAVLPTEFDDAGFAFYGTELRGTPKQRERWKRGVAAVNGSLGEAVGQVYVEKYFPEDSKTKMDKLVDNLNTAMAARLETLPWMGDETKEQAAIKLSKFTPKIGYPDEWKDYSDMEIVRGDAMGNAKRANEWAWYEQISKLGGPIDRGEWFISPQVVNAYYNPPMNEIVFPAAILQAPFFDPNADAAVNYGGIGAVIGHEIGHGFDDQGRKSDGDGVLRDWWTEEDKANFQKLADRKLGSSICNLRTR